MIPAFALLAASIWLWVDGFGPALLVVAPLGGFILICRYLPLLAAAGHASRDRLAWTYSLVFSSVALMGSNQAMDSGLIPAILILLSGGWILWWLQCPGFGKRKSLQGAVLATAFCVAFALISRAHDRNEGTFESVDDVIELVNRGTEDEEGPGGEVWTLLGWLPSMATSEELACLDREGLARDFLEYDRQDGPWGAARVALDTGDPYIAAGEVPGDWPTELIDRTFGLSRLYAKITDAKNAGQLDRESQALVEAALDRSWPLDPARDALKRAELSLQCAELADRGAFVDKALGRAPALVDALWLGGGHWRSVRGFARREGARYADEENTLAAVCLLARLPGRGERPGLPSDDALAGLRAALERDSRGLGRRYVSRSDRALARLAVAKLERDLGIGDPGMLFGLIRATPAICALASVLMLLLVFRRSPLTQDPSITSVDAPA